MILTIEGMHGQSSHGIDVDKHKNIRTFNAGSFLKRVCQRCSMQEFLVNGNEDNNNWQRKFTYLLIARIH